MQLYMYGSRARSYSCQVNNIDFVYFIVCVMYTEAWAADKFYNLFFILIYKAAFHCSFFPPNYSCTCYKNSHDENSWLNTIVMWIRFIFGGKPTSPITILST